MPNLFRIILLPMIVAYGAACLWVGMAVPNAVGLPPDWQGFIMIGTPVIGAFLVYLVIMWGVEGKQPR